MVGPMHDLDQHPSHKVELLNFQTHATTCDDPCRAVSLGFNSPGRREGEEAGKPYRISEVGVGDQVYIDRPCKPARSCLATWRTLPPTHPSPLLAPTRFKRSLVGGLQTSSTSCLRFFTG